MLPRLWNYLEGTIFKQYDAAPHAVVVVCQCIDQNQHNSLEAKSNAILFAPRSLESTLSGYILFKHLKYYLFHDPHPTTEKPKMENVQEVLVFDKIYIEIQQKYETIVYALYAEKPVVISDIFST